MNAEDADFFFPYLWDADERGGRGFLFSMFMGRGWTRISLFPCPLFEEVQGVVGGEVELEGCDGDAAGGQGAEVGAVFGDASGGFAADPVVGAAARVKALVEGVAIEAQSLAGD